MASEQRNFSTKISGNRQRNHKFTPEQRAAMVAEVYAGKSIRQVAASYSTDPGTISRTVKRWKENHNNVSGARSRRPQKLSARKIIYIQSFIKRNRSIT
jgi:transposase